MNATQTSNNCEVLVIKLNKQFWWFQYVSIFEGYIRMGPNSKYGIPSEIKPPLNFNCSWNFTISWNYQSGVLSICAGTNKARQRRSRSNLSIVSDVCHATDFIFFFLFPANYSMFWSTNTQRFLSLYNYLGYVYLLLINCVKKWTIFCAHLLYEGGA